MKTVKIGYDPHKYQRTKIIQEKSLICANTVRDILKEYNIVLDHEMFIDAITGGRKAASIIIDEAKQETKGIKSKIVRDNALKGIAENVEGMISQFKSMDSLRELEENTDLFEFTKGHPSLKQGWEDVLNDRAGIYLSDPKEIKINEAHQDVIKAINRLSAEMPERNIDHLLLRQIIHINDQGESSINEFTNYSFLANTKEAVATAPVNG